MASLAAVVPLMDGPECREYVTGRKMTAESTLKQFLGVVASMTYDPSLSLPAQTDEDYSRVRLGPAFFDLSLFEPGLLVELDQIAKVDHEDVFIEAGWQRAFIELHEFRHVATRSKHSTAKEYASWLKDLFNNCFKKKK